MRDFLGRRPITFPYKAIQDWIFPGSRVSHPSGRHTGGQKIRPDWFTGTIIRLLSSSFTYFLFPSWQRKMTGSSGQRCLKCNGVYTLSLMSCVLRVIMFSSDNGSNFDRAITLECDNGSNELEAISFHRCAKALCDNRNPYNVVTLGANDFWFCSEVLKRKKIEYFVLWNLRNWKSWKADK